MIKINGTALEFIKISGSLDYPFEERSLCSRPLSLAHILLRRVLAHSLERGCHSFWPLRLSLLITLASHAILPYFGREGDRDRSEENSDLVAKERERARDEWAPIKIRITLNLAGCFLRFCHIVCNIQMAMKRKCMACITSTWYCAHAAHRQHRKYSNWKGDNYQSALTWIDCAVFASLSLPHKFHFLVELYLNSWDHLKKNSSARHQMVINRTENRSFHLSVCVWLHCEQYDHH